MVRNVPSISIANDVVISADAHSVASAYRAVHDLVPVAKVYATERAVDGAPLDPRKRRETHCIFPTGNRRIQNGRILAV
jgi:hypothetical protein